jgi:hypothetical protein
MTRWKLPMSRRAVLLLAVAGLALAVFVPVALATTTPYWGYNNLTSSNPPANTCFSGSAAGIACSGWNNWDYSEADWTSGRSSWTLGLLCQSDGLIHGKLFYGSETFKTYDVLWSTYCPTHYNRDAVAHINGGTQTYNYLQARDVIYP